jgi:hypothetical protein
VSSGVSNLSRRGRGQTTRPRIYVGCLPCAKGRYVADVEHANRWLESHWSRCCRSTETLSLCRASESPRELRLT